MFEGLNEEIRRREQAAGSRVMRWLRHVAVFVASLFAFGALYAGIMLLE